jgi:hypothetical protein
VSAGCGGGGDDGAGGGGTTTAATAEALSMNSLCEDYSAAPARTQRSFAEEVMNEDQTLPEAIQFLNAACEGNGAMSIAEAVGQALAEQIAEEAAVEEDPYSETRVGGSLAAEIAGAVKRSWNRCNDSDVCIPGEYALSVGCRQPDPQVKELSCFVTTERGEGGSDYGYTVIVTVGADSYNWRLDRS